MALENPEKTTKETPPPIMGSWKRLYWFVLILHTIIILLFYIFTKVYS